MENGAIDYEDWCPPSEAELKIIEARRERQDKISKLMGDYLLKGYKMLASICPFCETILLRTKQEVDYCVACSELDCDSTKDDPALSEIAAQRQAQEFQLKEASCDMHSSATPSSASSSATNGSHSTVNSRKSSNLLPVVSTKEINSSADVEKPLTEATFPFQGVEPQLGEAAEAVLKKLEWATGRLLQTQDIDTCRRLCDLIKSCADAIHSVRFVEYRST